ncbi:MarR family transcriptional regulator [Rhodospirillaceae bacterium SYSU D60014]|uniref:MarR family transcriptional regulator n=1 Tax=Virgifigura deserti TaxID=2268457 RepID=UPI000E6642D7
MKMKQTDVLALWRHVLVTSLHQEAPDLTARQMALLLTVYTIDGPHTVRGLAESLKISKPAVTRALDRLSELDFARRKRDEADRRNVLIQRTVKGSVFLSEFAAIIAAAVEAKLPGQPNDRSE